MNIFGGKCRSSISRVISFISRWLLFSSANGSINAEVEATSVAVAGSTKNALTLTAGGLVTINKVSTDVQAYVDGDTGTADITTTGGDITLPRTACR